MGLEIVILTLLGTIASTCSLIFLPAAIELRHPKDAGPRFIRSELTWAYIVTIANMEEESPINLKLTKMFTGYFPAILSLES